MAHVRFSGDFGDQNIYVDRIETVRLRCIGFRDGGDGVVVVDSLTGMVTISRDVHGSEYTFSIKDWIGRAEDRA